MIRKAVYLAFLSAFALGCSSGSPAPQPIDAKLIEQTIAWYAEAGAAFRAAQQEVRSLHDAERVEKTRPVPVPRGAELIQWAKEHPTDPLAAPLLVTIAVYGQFGPEAQEAVQVLAKDQLGELKSPQFDDMFGELVRWPAPMTEAWLRTFLENSQIRRTRGVAGLLLAVFKRSLAEQAGVEPGPGWTKMMQSRFGEHAVDYVAELDAQALRSDAEAVLERVIIDYSDVDLGGGTTIGGIAKPMLFEWTKLAIGREVPEIDGTDLSGVPLKLSEYRGQVVLLSFWASWCDPCMRLVPHERELVKRYREKPFALLGINEDDNLDHALHASERMQMSWRSWRKVRKGPSLREQWNVHGIPTLYIVDKTGIIRGKQIFGEALEALLDTLVDDESGQDGGVRAPALEIEGAR